MASSDARPPPQYFAALSRNYTRQTGNSTRAIFESTLPLLPTPITAGSIVHDNAGGVGTATSVIVEKLSSAGDVPEILITDNSPAMIAAAKEDFAAHAGRISATELDSQDLSSLADGRFTHSLLNFSVFLFPDALAALREMHRTLRPDGVAVFNTWRRFGFSEIIHGAQAAVRPDLPRMPLPGTQFLNEGVLAKLVIDAGFDESRTKVVSQETVRSGEDLQGMKEFMLADFSNMATKGWSDEDKKKWPEAVETSIKKEIKEHGGIFFQSWNIVAQK